MRDIHWLFTIPIAHRGFYSSSIPENSILAFREAIKNGYNIELDIRKTKDDVLVVFHDNNLTRLTSLDKTIEDSLYSEINDLRLNKTEEKIPTFMEVLDCVRGQVGILIEIKEHTEIGRLEELLSCILDTYDGKFAIQSFNPFIIRWFFINRSHYIRGQLFGGFKKNGKSLLQQYSEKTLFLNIISRPDFITYEFEFLNTWIQFLARISRTPILVWTIRDPVDAKKAEILAQNLIFEGFHYTRNRE